MHSPLQGLDGRLEADAKPPDLLPMVSFVIPVLNDATGLARCLASIKANEYPDDRLEVIVVDNGSTDGSDEVAARAGATVLRLPGLSVAALRNRVAPAASGEILAFVDADHELSAKWLRCAVETLGHEGVGAVGAPYHPPEPATWVQRLYDSFREHRPDSADARWLGSGNLALWKWAFTRVGGFDTTLTTCEDVDLCQRLRQDGLRLVGDPRLHSVHYGDPKSLKQLFNSELWRGRDNLLVSLRGSLTMRDAPSIVGPILLARVYCGSSARNRPGAVSQSVAASWRVVRRDVPTIARAALILRRTGETNIAVAIQALSLAATYDVARALAMVIRKEHRRAR